MTAMTAMTTARRLLTASALALGVATASLAPVLTAPAQVAAYVWRLSHP